MHHSNIATKINNTQVDNAKDIDAVMPMYNLLEYGNKYSKKSNQTALDNTRAIVDFTN